MATYMSFSEKMILEFALRSEALGWGKNENELTKKVILTNPEKLANFSLNDAVNIFSEAGCEEWQYLLGAWLIDAVRIALEKNVECDLTLIFDTEFLARPLCEGKDYKRLTRKQIYDIAMKSFVIEEETEELLKISTK